MVLVDIEMLSRPACVSPLIVERALSIKEAKLALRDAARQVAGAHYDAAKNTVTTRDYILRIK